MEHAVVAWKRRASQASAAIRIRGNRIGIRRPDTTILLPLDGTTLHVRARHPERPRTYYGRAVQRGPAPGIHGRDIGPAGYGLVLRVRGIVVAGIDGFGFHVGKSLGWYYGGNVVVALDDDNREEDTDRGRGTEERVRQCLGRVGKTSSVCAVSWDLLVYFPLAR